MEKIHSLYFLGLIIIGSISTYVLIILPRGISIPAVETTFFLFGLALNKIILLWWIAGFLLYRWVKTGKKNPSLIIWSISFFIYSITFVAHVFRALGFSIANENLSVFHFFMYRWGMIVWAAGILYGLLKILTENKTYQLIPSILTLIFGFLWLILGLFIIPSANPIETTMYLFLHTIWIPVCFTMFYIFAYYGYKTKQNGPKLVALGFFGIMISYHGWAPWHFTDLVYIYFIWYFIFLLSLTPVLIGFIVMALEEKQ
ncbi:MAG: hypothetical protein EU532_06840 [Promethearchaeota archaeon]|nr:MAG: hypothetical protein EU532_06840 [Candidatus Lokiarchaeota archaeon]